MTSCKHHGKSGLMSFFQLPVTVPVSVLSALRETKLVQILHTSRFLSSNPNVPYLELLSIQDPTLTNISTFSADRPLIRIKRKGRPFATCSICNATPCSSPTEHARQKREIELKNPSKVTQTHNKHSQHRKTETSMFRKKRDRTAWFADLLVILENRARQTLSSPP